MVCIVAIAACYFGYYLWSRPWLLDFSIKSGTPSQLGERAPLAILLYSSVWSLGFPVDILFSASPAQLWTVGLVGGALMMLTARYMRKSARGDEAALFFILWAILFALPGLRALTTSTRTLCTATVGWAYLLAGLLVPTDEQRVVVPIFYRHVVFAANGIVSIACVVATVLIMNEAERSARSRLERAVATMDPPLADGDDLILTNAESNMEIICAGDRLCYVTGRRGVAATFLTPPAADVEFRRSDARTLVARSTAGGLLGAPFHRVARGNAWRPGKGETFRHARFEVEVCDVAPDGQVRELRFTFPGGLEQPGLHFEPPAVVRRGEPTKLTYSGAGP
jgi:hypothetical protein